MEEPTFNTNPTEKDSLAFVRQSILEAENKVKNTMEFAGGPWLGAFNNVLGGVLVSLHFAVKDHGLSEAEYLMYEKKIEVIMDRVGKKIDENSDLPVRLIFTEEVQNAFIKELHEVLN